MKDKPYIGDPPKSEQSEYIKYVALLRRSLGDAFTKLTKGLQDEVVTFLKTEVDAAVTKGLKSLTITLPDNVLKRLTEKPEMPPFPTTMTLAPEDVAKLTPKPVVLPKYIALDAASIAKITEVLAKRDEPLSKQVEAVVAYFQKKPDAWFNVRLTDGDRFYAALKEAFVSAGGGGKSVSFIGPDGKPTMAQLDTDGNLKVKMQGSATGGLTDDELRATPVVVTISGGGTGGAGDASAANQVIQTTTLSGIQQVLERINSIKFDVALSVIDARLASIVTNTDQLEGYVDQLEGFVDQLESYTDGLEGLMQGVQNTMTSISGRDFATEATLATRASQVTVSGIQQVLEGLRTSKFDVALSTRASEATLATIATQVTASGMQQILEDLRTNHFDVALSTRASETTVSGIARVTEALRQKFDVQLSTVATQTTVSGIQQILENVRQNIVFTASTPTVYNVTMTNADTEYSQALPANTRKYTIQCRTANDVRFAFVTGKVATPTAPYMTLKSGATYFEDNLKATLTLYVACGTAGKEVEIIAWT